MAEDRGPVEAAVAADLATLAKRDKSLAGSALAASALTLAREMDGQNSATSKSMCAKVLMETLDRLRALAPAQIQEDRVDEIAKRRERRLRASAN